MRVVRVVLALAVSWVFVGKLLAADQSSPPPQPEHQGHEKNFVMMGPWNMLKELNLTDEQKAKVQELRKEYVPKFKEATDSVLTTDQKKARDDAIKAAKDAGKKGELFTVKLKLTDEQKAKIREAITPLEKELREKTQAILTPEQREQLKAKMAERMKMAEQEAVPWNMLKELNLTDEQKEKIKAILTPEQREQLKTKMAEHMKMVEQKAVTMGPWNMLKELNLTDEQKAKVQELRKEYQSKFKAASDSVLTTDQKKARDDAIKAAKEAGKMGGVVSVKLKLTDEQKAKMREAIKPLEKEVSEKTQAILTPEQREQLKTKMAEHMKMVEQKAVMMGPWNMLKELNLTDEQKAKVQELRKKYQSKFKEASDSVLTTDQKKARDDAVKAGRDAGGGYFTLTKLTDEQQAKRREAVTILGKELHEKIMAILTPEQQEQLKAKMAEEKAGSK